MKKLMVLAVFLLSCECEEVYYNNDFTSGELSMATQNLIMTAYPPTWSVVSATAGYGFEYNSNVLKSGHGLLYYSNLGGTLEDQATELQLYFDFALQETNFERPGEGQMLRNGGAPAGQYHVEIFGYDFLKVGDKFKFAGHATEYTITLVDKPDIYFTPNLTSDIADGEQLYHLSCTNDIGVALFHNIVETEEVGLVLVYNLAGTQEEYPTPYRNFKLYVYDSGIYYPAKYKDGANYRENARYECNFITTDTDQKIGYSWKLTNNRYLKLFENSQLLELTADSLGANVTTVDIQNIYYDYDNTQYVPDAGGFYVGVSSGAYDRVQTAGRYSYLDNIRVRQ